MIKIYLIRNKTNNKMYVGRTAKTLDERLKIHFSETYEGRGTVLHKALHKYGLENFEISLLEEFEDISIQDERESFWIEKLGTFGKGYNMNRGGFGGDVSVSPKWQKAMKERDYNGSKNPNFGKLGKDSPNFGKIRTEETKLKLKIGCKKSWTDERKTKASKMMEGSNNPRYGKVPWNAIPYTLEGKIYLSKTIALKETQLTWNELLERGIIKYVGQ